MKTTKNLLDIANKNNLNDEAKLLSFIEKLEVKELNEALNKKNGFMEYEGTIKDEAYTLLYQPNRKEVVIYAIDKKGHKERLCEVYFSKRNNFKVCTRGAYLLKMTTTKKQEALKGILKEALEYHEKWDMKHAFHGLTLTTCKGLIDRLMRLDNNLTLTCNDYVKEYERLDSIKTIRTQKLEEEEG